jgi:hypothetical protein
VVVYGLALTAFLSSPHVCVGEQNLPKLAKKPRARSDLSFRANNPRTPLGWAPRARLEARPRSARSWMPS